MTEQPNSGITPACAGNTGMGLPVGRLRQDHPRMRGEHRDGIARRSIASGSPPHARGTRIYLWAQKHTGRITPACAGNTKRKGKAQHSGEDHPRMRGEHLSPIRLAITHAIKTGSPPHARGTLVPPVTSVPVPWITPACAGNTPTLSQSCTAYKDHPRMRGEHRQAQRHKLRRRGSPPHARGTREDDAQVAREIRITPACAGNTAFFPLRSTTRPDHPRMRGEHRPRGYAVSWQLGSPPHARGTH